MSTWVSISPLVDKEGLLKPATAKWLNNGIPWSKQAHQSKPFVVGKSALNGVLSQILRKIVQGPIFDHFCPKLVC